MAAGLKIKKPKIKAPKAPKAPKLKKVDPGKAKGAAKKKVLGALKKIFNIKVLIIVLIIVAVILITLMLTIWAPGPKDTVEEAIEAAFETDADLFKTHFTEESVARLELIWGTADGAAAPTIIRDGSWKEMMRDTLTMSRSRPEIIGEKVDGEHAEVYIDQDGTRRVVHLVLVEDDWRIHVPKAMLNQAMPPLNDGEEIPEEIEEKIKENAPPNPNALWWEGREAAEKEKAKKGCLGCTVAPAEGRGLPGDTLVWIVALALLLLARARAQSTDRPLS